MAMVQCKDVPLRSWAKMFTTGVGRSKMPLAKLLSEGNIKIPPETAIFNMTSAKNCPSLKLGLCQAFCDGKHICYAKKAEYSCYPNVLPYRMMQEEYWKNITANEFVVDFVLVNSLKAKPFTSLRFNESGDFTDQRCVDKAEKIASMLHRFGIRCYNYTSRKDLDFSRCRYLVVSGSNFTKKGISNIFKIIKNKKELPKGFGLCKGNCRVCKRCLMRNMKTCVIKH